MQAEVIGTASAAFALLESAIVIIEHLRDAKNRRKDLVAVLEKHDLELKNLKSLIQIVKAEKELRTEAVGVELRKLVIIEAKLVDHLERIEPGEEKLTQIMEELH